MEEDREVVIGKRLVEVVLSSFPNTEYAWVRGYSTVGVQLEQSKAFRLGSVVVMLFSGSFSHPVAPVMKWVGNRLELTMQPSVELPHDVYLFLLTPYDATAEGAEAKTRALLDVTAGLLIAAMSPSIAVGRLFEYQEHTKELLAHVASKPMLVPGFFPVPVHDRERVRLVCDIADDIPQMKEKKRNRVTLSLRWYAQAYEEQDHVDQFIKFWVALEALVMSEGRAKLLLELIASAYGMSERDADTRFGINAIAQLRGDILHGGKTPSLHGTLMRMVAALYEDALMVKVGKPILGSAAKVYPKKTFRLHDYVNNPRMPERTTLPVDTRGDGETKS